MSISINPGEVINTANQIREKGEELNKLFVNIADSIVAMNSVWKGKQYLNFVAMYDKSIEARNDLVTSVRERIPASLKSKANDYNNISGKELVDTSIYEVKYSELDVDKDDSIIAIDEAAVNDIKDTLTSYINSARSLMEEIETMVNGVAWESDNAEEYKKVVHDLKNSILEDFDNLEANFTTWTRESIEILQRTDKI